MTTLNPFAGTDFAQKPPQPYGPPQDGGSPDFSYERLGVEGAPVPYQDDAQTQLVRAQQNYDRLISTPKYQKQTYGGQSYESGDLDPGYQLEASKALADLTFWRNRRLTEIDREQVEATKAIADAQRREDAAATRANQAYLSQLGHEAALIRDASNRAFQREERIAGQEFDLEKMGRTQDFGRSEREAGQEFDLTQLGKEHEFRQGERIGSQEFTRGEREARQSFDAEQNAADRMLKQLDLQIAAGELNKNTALGILQKFLEAQPFTLPAGAEYVPGFQPGGGVQEAARLAGVSYNPANYRANTVPFDPAEVVRKTMGR